MASTSHLRSRFHSRRQWSAKGFALLAQLSAVPDYAAMQHTALRGVCSVLHTSQCSVTWLASSANNAVYSIVPHASQPCMIQPDTALANYIQLKQRPLVVRDVSQVSASLPPMPAHASGALLAVPILHGATVSGILSAQSNRPRRWQAADVALLEAIAAELAQAWQRDHLRHELEQRADELATVYNTALRISANLDLSTTLHTIVEQAARLAHAAGGGLYLHDAERAELEVVVSYQLDRDYRGQRIRVGEGLAGRAVVSQQIERTDDYGSWDGRAQCYAAAPFHAVLAVPLLQDGHVLGVLDLLQTTLGASFSDKDVAVVQLFAAQAAVAIANARLYDVVSRQAQRMAELAQASQLLDVHGGIAASMKPLAAKSMQVLRAQACIVELCGIAPPETIHIHIVGATEAQQAALLGADGWRCACVTRADATASAEHEGMAAAVQAAVRAASFASTSSLPLLRDDQQLGCITFLYTEPYTWDDGEGEIARVIANQMAALLANAQLFHEAHEANRLKSEFIATISHELRTPMGAILGYAELLTSGSYGTLPSTMSDPLSRLRTNANNLLQLINQMLDLSRIEAGRLELRQEPFSPRDLLAAVDAAAQPQLFGKAVIFDHAVSGNVPAIIMGDVARLQQMLTNLVDNSLKFTPRGSVELRCDCTRHSDQPELVFEVRDTGPGIAPETVAVIWEPFRQGNSSETRQHSGVGLGLAIVHKLVLLMGGTATVSSELGVGSTFRIRLPLLLPSG